MNKDDQLKRERAGVAWAASSCNAFTIATFSSLNSMELSDFICRYGVNDKKLKNKKVILLNNTESNVNVLLSNIAFFDFRCFRCVTHHVAVNICTINCSFFTFIFAVL